VFDAMTTTAQQHWDRIYSTKVPHEVSWTQENPSISLDFIHEINLSKTARIIDVGGGESKLVDRLLDEGFTDITVLDISEEALRKTRQRLGERAGNVQWVVSDVREFKPVLAFDLWHDRATFHFMTSPEDIDTYLLRAQQAIRSEGYFVVGTFSDKGPKKCSGLDIRQYTEITLEQQLNLHFQKIRCITEDHHTPFGTLQNFLFCSFKKYGP
jgi:ubiquinone/menaquinone biosynthesis C-methylase UbiE